MLDKLDRNGKNCTNQYNRMQWPKERQVWFTQNTSNTEWEASSLKNARHVHSRHARDIYLLAGQDHDIVNNDNLGWLKRVGILGRLRSLRTTSCQEKYSVIDRQYASMSFFHSLTSTSDRHPSKTGVKEVYCCLTLIVSYSYSNVSPCVWTMFLADKTTFDGASSSVKGNTKALQRKDSLLRRREYHAIITSCIQRQLH